MDRGWLLGLVLGMIVGYAIGMFDTARILLGQ